MPTEIAKHHILLFKDNAIAGIQDNNMCCKVICNSYDM